MYKYKTYTGQEIQIDSRQLVHQYFDYSQIIGILDGKYPEDFTKIVTEDCPLRKIIAEKYECLPAYLKEDKKPGKWVLVKEQLLNKLDLSDDYSKALGRFIPSNPFSTEQAYELLRFFALFQYGEHIPEEGDLEKLTQRLRLDDAQIEAAPKNPMEQFAMPILLTRSVTTLPSFAGSSELKTLQLNIIRNTSDQTALVRLKECPLQRHLKPGEEITVLMANGAVAAFVPQICATSDYVYYRETNRVIARDAHQKEYFTEIENVAFFAVSADYGFLASRTDGSFYGEGFKGQAPEEKICWLSAAPGDYGFLSPEGTYAGEKPCKAWNKLLCFDLSTGGGAAITAKREAIDRNGNCLGKNAAAVSCFGTHCILLLMDGTVKINQGTILKFDSPVRAVCADKDGYWIATDRKLLFIDALLHQTQVGEEGMDEIERDGLGRAVYGLNKNGEICRLR